MSLDDGSEVEKRKCVGIKRYRGTGKNETGTNTWNHHDMVQRFLVVGKIAYDLGPQLTWQNVGTPTRNHQVARTHRSPRRHVIEQRQSASDPLVIFSIAIHIPAWTHTCRYGIVGDFVFGHPEHFLIGQFELGVCFVL